MGAVAPTIPVGLVPQSIAELLAQMAEATNGAEPDAYEQTAATLAAACVLEAKVDAIAADVAQLLAIVAPLQALGPMFSKLVGDPKMLKLLGLG